METPDTSWAYIDFRINNAGSTNTAIFYTKDHPNGYVNEATFGFDPNLFSAGKEVNVTFTFVTETQLQVEAGELVMVYTYTRGLRDVTGVWISHDVDVTSFDLWC
ncbi:hypothetical protein V1264_015350 [Littorina saxatilis]|uniref:Uncharacterized protein n=2 Tax=Littorina saxatilis TaxID=31220 RepID=A0AAN9BLK1_9CAEN